MNRAKLALLGFVLPCLLIASCGRGAAPSSDQEPAASVEQERAMQLSQSSSRRAFPEFPWQPPKPSAQFIIPSRLLVTRECTPKLRDVADRLEDALEAAGYKQTGWYSIPNGFAVVTGVERINPDGAPVESSAERWSEAYKAPEIFTIADYLKSLFTARVGCYRVMVFTVTDSVPEFTGAPSPDTAKRWYSSGESQLPREIGRREFTVGHHCLVLIYEFECSASKKEPVFKDPSAIQGSTHLEKSKILKALGA